MDKYYCVFKLPDQAIPTHISFEAQHPGAAIIKLMDVAKITNTMQLEQAEILKVVYVEDKDKKCHSPSYVSVFVKEKDDRKGKVILSNSQKSEPVINVPVVEEQLDVYKKPYIIEVL